MVKRQTTLMRFSLVFDFDFQVIIQALTESFELEYF